MRHSSMSTRFSGVACTLFVMAAAGFAVPALAADGIGFMSPAAASLLGAPPPGSAVPGSALEALRADMLALQPDVNPADAARERPGQKGEHVPAYELPPVTVEGSTGSSLHEEERVGSYGQPRWTTSRLFPSTRIYVIPENAIELEYWYRPTFKRNGDIEVRMLGEVEVGLPHRFQLDVYFRTDQDDIDSHLMYGQQVELRWALADWGKIWGNPTLYFEYINLEDRPDKIEPKLLLGGEIPQWGEGWHWGVNFVAELEINGPEREHEYEFTSGLSKTIVDSCFSAGGVFKFSLIDVNDDRGHFETPFLLGPTFQWRPIPRWSINVETLVGLGGESPYGQITFNTGFEF